MGEINLSNYRSDLISFANSEQLASVGSNNLGASFNSFDLAFKDAYEVDAEDEAEMKKISEEVLTNLKNKAEIPRFIPKPEEFELYYGSQAPDLSTAKNAEDKIAIIDKWKEDGLKKSSDLIPSQTDDFKTHLDYLSNSFIREAVSDDNKTGWLGDKVYRAVEGAMSMVTPFVPGADRFLAENLPENTGMDEDISSLLFAGAGQLVSQAAIALVTSAVAGPQAGVAAIGTIYSARALVEGYKEEMRKSGNPDKALDVGLAGIPGAALETFADSFTFGLGSEGVSVLKAFKEATTEAAKRAVLKAAIPSLGKKALTSGLGEAGVGSVGADFTTGYGRYLASGDESYIPTAEQLAKGALVEGLLGAGYTTAFDRPTTEMSNVAKDLKTFSQDKANADEIFKALKSKNYDLAVELATKDYANQPEKKTEASKIISDGIKAPSDEAKAKATSPILPNHRLVLKTKLKEFEKAGDTESAKRISDTLKSVNDGSFTAPESFGLEAVAPGFELTNAPVSIDDGNTVTLKDGTEVESDESLIYVKGISTSSAIVHNVTNNGVGILLDGSDKASLVFGNKTKTGGFSVSQTPKVGYTAVKVNGVHGDSKGKFIVSNFSILGEVASAKKSEAAKQKTQAVVAQASEKNSPQEVKDAGQFIQEVNGVEGKLNEESFNKFKDRRSVIKDKLYNYAINNPNDKNAQGLWFEFVQASVKLDGLNAENTESVKPVRENQDIFQRKIEDQRAQEVKDNLPKPILQGIPTIGSQVSYNGYEGSLQTEGDNKYIIKTKDGNIVEVSDVSEVMLVKNAANSTSESMVTAIDNPFVNVGVNSANREIPQAQLDQAYFTPTTNDEMSVTDQFGNKYIPHNESLSKNFKITADGGLEVLVRSPSNPGKIIRLVGPQALQIQEAFLENVTNLENAGYKVDLNSKFTKKRKNPTVEAVVATPEAVFTSVVEDVVIESTIEDEIAPPVVTLDTLNAQLAKEEASLASVSSDKFKAKIQKNIEVIKSQIALLDSSGASNIPTAVQQIKEEIVEQKKTEPVKTKEKPGIKPGQLAAVDIESTNKKDADGNHLFTAKGKSYSVKNNKAKGWHLSSGENFIFLGKTKEEAKVKLASELNNDPNFGSEYVTSEKSNTEILKAVTFTPPKPESVDEKIARLNKAADDAANKVISDKVDAHIATIENETAKKKWSDNKDLIVKFFKATLTDPKNNRTEEFLSLGDVVLKRVEALASELDSKVANQIKKDQSERKTVSEQEKQHLKRVEEEERQLKEFAGKVGIRYSISSSTPETSISQEEAQEYIDANNLNVNIEDTQEVTEDGHQWNGRVDFRSGTPVITVNLANIRDVAHLRNVINEELGHIAFNSPEVSGMLGKIKETTKLRDGIKELYKESDLAEESVVKRMADLVDSYSEKGMFDKLVTAIKSYVKDKLGMELNDSDLSYIAYKAINKASKVTNSQNSEQKLSVDDSFNNMASSGGGFFFGMSEVVDGKIIRRGKGDVTPRKDGTISIHEFKQSGGQLGVLQDGEIEFYKELVPTAFEGDRVNIQNLWDGLKGVGEQIQVVTYGQDGVVSEAKAKFDEAIGELDRLGFEWGNNEQAQLAKSSEMQKWFDQATANREEANKASSGPRATSYYNQISPFDTKKFPVLRVDVVLPMKAPSGEDVLTGNYVTGADGKAVKRGELRWQPDNLHENLPNTLGWAMVQIVPDPKTGENVMFVGELQSRWAQAKRKDDERAKASGIGTTGFPVEGHTLLPIHQNLILKAVIKEAQKQGISKVAVSDGETAMMTEGHDTNNNNPVATTQRTPLDRYDVAITPELRQRRSVLGLLKEERAKSDSKEGGIDYGDAKITFKDGTVRSEKETEEYAGKFGLGWHDISSINIGRFIRGKTIIEPSQSKGMRLAYDTTMPSIMKKLVGEGKMEDFGVHKNAEQKPNLAGVPISEWDNPANQAKVGSPVFRNPDGTPKTNVTARVYDIKNPSPRIKTMFSKVGPSNNTTDSQTSNGLDGYTETPDIFSVLTNNITTEQRETFKKIQKMLRKKLEKKLIVDEPAAWSLLKSIKFGFLKQESLKAYNYLLDEFVRTRSKNRDPKSDVRDSAETVIAKASELAKEANQGHFDFLQMKHEFLEDKDFTNDYQGDIDLVMQLAKDDRGHKDSDLPSDKDGETLQTWQIRTLELQDLIFDNLDYVNDRLEEMFPSSNISTSNPILSKYLGVFQNNVDEVIAKQKEMFKSRMNQLMSDPTDKSYRDLRKQYFGLMDFLSDGYALNIEDFVTQETADALATKLEDKDIMDMHKSPWRKKWLAGASSFYANTRMLGSKVADITSKLTNNFRSGIMAAERIHDEFTKPVLKEMYESAVAENGGKDFNGQEHNHAGIYSMARAFKSTEGVTEGILNSKRSIETSIKKDIESVWSGRKKAAKDHLEFLNNLFIGITKDTPNEEALGILEANAEKILPKGLISYVKGINELFEATKPLAKFTSEFGLGRPFEEWVNYTPSLAITKEGQPIEFDVTEMSVNVSSDESVHGDTNMQRGGGGSMKDRTRRLGNSMVYVFNINHLAENRMRLNLIDYLTLQQRRELNNVISGKGTKHKEFAKLLKDEDGGKERVSHLQTTVRTMWSNTIQSASFISEFQAGVNVFSNMWASGKLASLYQFPGQVASNLAPYFVVNSGSPKRIKYLFDAMGILLKKQMGQTLEPRLDKVVSRILSTVHGRSQEQFLDKSIALDVNGSAVWQQVKTSSFWNQIKGINRLREKILFSQFIYSDMMTGAPMMLANMMAHEEAAGRATSWDGLTFNDESFIKAVDEAERFVGIGASSRRGVWTNNKNGYLVTLRNMLSAFSSHRVNNATNFAIELAKVNDSNTTSEEKAQSVRYMLGIQAQSVVFSVIKWGMVGAFYNLLTASMGDEENEDELEKKYRKLLTDKNISKEQKLTIQAEISMLQKIRNEYEKVKDKNNSYEVLVVRGLQDMVSNSFLIPAATDIPVNALIHNTYDKYEAERFNEVKESELKQLNEKLKKAKDSKNISAAIELQKDISRWESQEAITFVYEGQSIIPFDGVYGGVMKDAAKFVDSASSALLKAEPLSMADVFLGTGLVGLSQPELNKIARLYAKKEEYEAEYKEKIDELKKKKK